MNNTEKLLKTITDKKCSWNEYSTFTIKGVKNLSLSDLDTIELYCLEYLNSGEKHFGELSFPLGLVKDVLDKFNIGVKEKSIFL